MSSANTSKRPDVKNVRPFFADACHVTGITTAATIWMCAVRSIVCGLVYWVILGITVGLTAFVLLLGRPLERLAEKLFHRRTSGPPDHSV